MRLDDELLLLLGLGLLGPLLRNLVQLVGLVLMGTLMRHLGDRRRLELLLLGIADRLDLTENHSTVVIACDMLN